MCSTPQFTPVRRECPDASKLGKVEVKTPLLDHPLPGAIYLARQGENPFGSLIAVYIIVNDPVTGIVVKLAGKVETDPVTGQISTTVDQSPQVPFEDFKITLFGGSASEEARARLTTPATCGGYSTTSLLSPVERRRSRLTVSPAFAMGEAPVAARARKQRLKSRMRRRSAPGHTVRSRAPTARSCCTSVAKTVRRR